MFFFGFSEPLPSSKKSTGLGKVVGQMELASPTWGLAQPSGIHIGFSRSVYWDVPVANGYIPRKSHVIFAKMIYFQ